MSIWIVTLSTCRFNRCAPPIYKIQTILDEPCVIIHPGNHVIPFGYLNCFVRRFLPFGFKMSSQGKMEKEAMVSFDSILFNRVLLVLREKNGSGQIVKCLGHIINKLRLKTISFSTC